MKAPPGSDGLLRNGYLVLANLSDGRRNVLHCGARVRAKEALLIEGPLKDGKSLREALDVSTDQFVKITVSVDMEKDQLRCTVNEVSFEKALPDGLSEITHIGYAVDGALMDFESIRVSH